MRDKILHRPERAGRWLLPRGRIEAAEHTHQLPVQAGKQRYQIDRRNRFQPGLLTHVSPSHMMVLSLTPLAHGMIFRPSNGTYPPCEMSSARGAGHAVHPSPSTLRLQGAGAAY